MNHPKGPWCSGAALRFPPRMSRFVLRAVASVLPLASAGMSVAASAQRWWPACRRSMFDTDAYLRLQDHLYDHVHVSEPWVPVGSATTYAGVALFLLAGAAAVLPFARRPVGVEDAASRASRRDQGRSAGRRAATRRPVA